MSQEGITIGVFRKVGKGLGVAGGLVIGGTVKVTGKAVGTRWKKTGEWIEDVGEHVYFASKNSLDTAGQFVDGAVEGTYGFLKKDEYFKQQGIHHLKDSTGRTIKGIGTVIRFTSHNVGTTYKGVKNGDSNQIIHSIGNLGKIVAVSGLAIGVVDVIVGTDVVEAQELETRNDHLSGTEHAITGVPFIEKSVELPSGQVIEGTFPVFEYQFSTVISEQLYLESDDVHFRIANDTLYQAIQNEPTLASDLGLSQADIQALSVGKTPDGYTWHHFEEPGVIQLVDEEVHAETGHTGGRAIWGGGNEFRYGM